MGAGAVKRGLQPVAVCNGDHPRRGANRVSDASQRGDDLRERRRLDLDGGVTDDVAVAGALRARDAQFEATGGEILPEIPDLRPLE